MNRDNDMTDAEGKRLSPPAGALQKGWRVRELSSSKLRAWQSFLRVALSFSTSRNRRSTPSKRKVRLAISAVGQKKFGERESVIRRDFEKSVVLDTYHFFIYGEFERSLLFGNFSCNFG